MEKYSNNHDTRMESSNIAVDSSLSQTHTHLEAIQVIDILSSPEEVVEIVQPKQSTKRRASKQASLFAKKELKAKPQPIQSKKATTKNTADKSKQRALKRTTTKRDKAPVAQNNIPLMFQGLDQNQLMAEQAAVEFRAKRLLQQKKDRERAEKRQQQLDQRQITFDASSAKSKSHNSNRPKSCESIRAPRFPVPSHVIPSESNIVQILNDKQLFKPFFSSSSNSKPWWRRETTEPEVIDVDDISSEPCFSLLPPKDSIYSREPPAVDLLQLACDSILIPPIEFKTKSRLWADVYFNDKLLVDGFIPAHLQSISDEMINFVQEWMVERQNAHNRAAEKQRQLTRRQQPQHRLAKKAKLAKTYTDDDDEWMDSDGEEIIEGLKNLCHVTGPTGVGKSALVYAVARHCGCRVIELNPSDKRGAAAMRRAIEEATQSHSSMEMLQKQKRSDLQSADLENSDQEETENNRSALPVILIDEIDNLVASDSGFWSALSDLTKKAKCPIFLTSNVQPEEIKVIFGRCGVLPVRRALPDECVEFIRSVLDGEGFTLQSDNQEVEKSLALIADLCNSDMRRIAHELQLFAARLSSKESFVDSSTTATNTFEEIAWDFKTPQVFTVEPRAVRFDQYELLTITGTGFLELAMSPRLPDEGYQVEVCIGERPCPVARIMNDFTIFAVAVPVSLPQHYSRFKRYYDEEYQSITVSGIKKIGIISTSSSSVSVMESPSGMTMLQCGDHVVLQRHFSDAQHLTDGDGDSSSDDEMEFDELKPVVKSTIVARQPAVDLTKALRVLEQAVANWEGVCPDVQDRVIDQCSIESVNKMSESASLISDATLIDDIGSLGLPYLSGACRGFGFDMTGAYPATTSENTKPQVIT
jgi:DNA polymerase III delta prime subunit